MKTILLSVVFALTLGSVSAQTIDEHSRSPQPKVSSNKKQRDADKKKEKQKKEAEKAIEKGRKRHMSYQDKATRRRMKKNRRKAGDWNKH